jgi:hypothetical protein
VTRPDGIELRQGCGRWERAAQAAISLLAAMTVLTAAAPATLVAGLLAALFTLHVGTTRRMHRAAASVPRIRLFDDGTAALLTRTGAVPALLGGCAWASRWFSVVPIQPLDGRRRLFCIVCRSTNPADAYRRLLVLLRMRDGQDPTSRWGWS